jgi:hypothetical protein
MIYEDAYPQRSFLIDGLLQTLQRHNVLGFTFWDVNNIMPQRNLRKNCSTIRYYVTTSEVVGIWIKIHLNPNEII